MSAAGPVRYASSVLASAGMGSCDGEEFERPVTGVRGAHPDKRRSRPEALLGQRDSCRPRRRRDLKAWTGEVLWDNEPLHTGLLPHWLAVVFGLDRRPASPGPAGPVARPPWNTSGPRGESASHLFRSFPRVNTCRQRWTSGRAAHGRTLPPGQSRPDEAGQAARSHLSDQPHLDRRRKNMRSQQPGRLVGFTIRLRCQCGHRGARRRHRYASVGRRPPRLRRCRRGCLCASSPADRPLDLRAP
jgi:hypothetical protein